MKEKQVLAESTDGFIQTHLPAYISDERNSLYKMDKNSIVRTYIDRPLGVIQLSKSASLVGVPEYLLDETACAIEAFSRYGTPFCISRDVTSFTVTISEIDVPGIGFIDLSPPVEVRPEYNSVQASVYIPVIRQRIYLSDKKEVSVRGFQYDVSKALSSILEFTSRPNMEKHEAVCAAYGVTLSQCRDTYRWLLKWDGNQRQW